MQARVSSVPKVFDESQECAHPMGLPASADRRKPYSVRIHLQTVGNGQERMEGGGENPRRHQLFPNFGQFRIGSFFDSASGGLGGRVDSPQPLQVHSCHASSESTWSPLHFGQSAQAPLPSNSPLFSKQGEPHHVPDDLRRETVALVVGIHLPIFSDACSI